MRKMISGSLVFAVAIAMLVLGVAVSSRVALAQDTTAAPQSTVPGPGQAAEDKGARNNTDQGFDNWMRKNPQASEEIRKDPSLLNNPQYMANHPDLQNYMNSHPDFKNAVAQNPNKVVHHTEHQQRMARERKAARRNQ